MLNTYKFRLNGIAPLLMHNGRMIDPMNPFSKALKELTSTRKKTDEIHDEISKAEWRGSLYEHNGVVGLPADMITAAVVEGAKKSKMGKQASAGLYEAETFFPLIYEGPKDIEQLYADRRFVDVRSVRVQQSRVMRTRPVFHDWAVVVALMVEESVIEPRQVQQALEQCGLLVGIGDFRPRYGRFTVEAL